MKVTKAHLSVAAGVVAVVVLGGVAYADVSPSSSPSSSTSSSGTAAKHARAHHAGRVARIERLGTNVEYGTLVVKTKTGDKTVAVQTGAITSVSSTALTVTSADGHVQSYVLATTSRVRAAGAKASASTLAVGDKVSVVADVTGSTDTVLFVREIPAAATTTTTGTTPSSTPDSPATTAS